MIKSMAKYGTFCKLNIVWQAYYCKVLYNNLWTISKILFKYSKKAALDKDVTLIKLPYTYFKQGINLYIRKLWQLAWDVQVDILYDLCWNKHTTLSHP